MPKLMNIELFNPEIDDVDSDSSGVSSPDSIGSVISVVNEDTLVQALPVQAARKWKINITGKHAG